MDAYLTHRVSSPSKKSEKRRKTGEKEKTEKRASMEAVKASIIMSYKCEKNGRDGEI